jgi:hypothetical protein
MSIGQQSPNPGRISLAGEQHPIGVNDSIAVATSGCHLVVLDPADH